MTSLVCRLPVGKLVMVEGRWGVRRGRTPSTVQGVVVRHPVLLGLAPPGGVQAQQAGGDDAELEEDHGGTSSDDDRPGGAHNLSILVSPTDEDSSII